MKMFYLFELMNLPLVVPVASSTVRATIIYRYIQILADFENTGFS